MLSSQLRVVGVVEVVTVVLVVGVFEEAKCPKKKEKVDPLQGWCLGSKLVIGLVRPESLRPGFADSGFESSICGSTSSMGWLDQRPMQADCLNSL